ncbi:hypothetical protein IE81DRAFT_230879 [Ceraceosorus guamensis]|uniref:Uncharacterized protein n=1 Tax=Ceraceosorus guamensis TaxID=1522189 RepID=A0A316W7M5_9BASI|nr:hypothetical protein IE81DRAFT_230879 [Ceraceosorus guamensis]PWN45138.1 hypothetical protein IE81DRAFT_230879 [Ceraceosorus guamensis]
MSTAGSDCQAVVRAARKLVDCSGDRTIAQRAVPCVCGVRSRANGCDRQRMMHRRGCSIGVAGVVWRCEVKDWTDTAT